MADWTPSRGQNAFQNVGAAGGVGWIAEQLGFMGNRNGGCSENTPVTRYELGMQNTITEKDMEIATLRAVQASKDYTNAGLVDLSDRLLARFEKLNDRVCTNEKEQAVWNGTTAATMSCIAGQVQNVQNLLASLTKTMIPSSNVCNNDYPVVVTNTACNPVYTQATK